METNTNYNSPESTKFSSFSSSENNSPIERKCSSKQFLNVINGKNIASTITQAAATSLSDSSLPIKSSDSTLNVIDTQDRRSSFTCIIGSTVDGNYDDDNDAIRGSCMGGCISNENKPLNSTNLRRRMSLLATDVWNLSIDEHEMPKIILNRESQKYVTIDNSASSPPVTPIIKSGNKSKDKNKTTTSTTTKLYPKCDSSVWLRSCEQEIIEPINGQVKGNIPKWLKGSLLRNGPGSLKVGNMKFKHLFDSSALLHRFGINDGKVTYQCRFVETDVYKKNKKANRIVVTEFGTTPVPDPCHTIFQRISAIFKPGEFTDNSMISIYPFGDEYFTFTEYPVIHGINPETLETVRKLNVNDYIGIVNHTAHPHIMPDGTVYNLGMTVTKNGPSYNIICFPNGNSMFEDAHIVATIPSRWKFYPGYMHSFGITEHYFVIVEQPLSISVPQLMKSHIKNSPLASCFKWFSDKNTCFYLICRKTGKLKYTYEAEAFFYLHIINSYELDGEYVIVDICCYKDPSMLDCMYIEEMENMQSNPDYARMFRGKPLRFVLPINGTEKSLSRLSLSRTFSITNLFAKFNGTKPKLQRSFSDNQRIKYSTIDSPMKSSNSARINELVDDFDNNQIFGENLIKLENTEAQAFLLSNSKIYCKPEVLCDLGCETPRIFYESYLGKKYQYFYAISSDVDGENPGTLIKVDVENKTKKTWYELNCYPSEPIFVPNPYSAMEDDGIVLAAMIWGGNDENKVGLLILCAKTWREIGRCEFETPGPVPKCLHGWFSAASE